MALALCARERLVGEWGWTLSLAVRGVVGGLLSLLKSLGLGYGRSLGGVGGKFLCYIRFEVRDSSKVRFWHDQLCGDVILKEAFLDLYVIACTKDAFVVANLEFYGGFI
jgi:hypothetical protein